jgi:hypothetical protein
LPYNGRLRSALALLPLLFLSHLVACEGCEPAGAPDAGVPEDSGVPDDIDLSASRVTVSPASGVPADGISAYRVTTALVDRAGEPLAGRSVALRVSAQGTSVTQPPATSALGTTTGTVASTTPGDVRLEVLVEGSLVLADLTLTFLEACEDIEQLFERTAWGPVFSRCAGCHNGLGLARAYGLAFSLEHPGVDGWAEHNVSVIAALAAETTTGPAGSALSRLIAKPTGQAVDEGHEGGTVIAPGSEEARVLEAFAALALDPPATCGGAIDDVQLAVADLELLSPRETYARAVFALTGRTPTLEEVEAMADTEEALSNALDGLLASEAFLERLAEMYGDWTLTDEALFFDGVALGPNNPRFFFFDTPCAAPGQNNCCDANIGGCCQDTRTPEECRTLKTAAQGALAREPLEMVKRIAREGLSMGELVSSTTGLLTPLSAILRGATDEQIAGAFDADPTNDATEFRPFTLRDTEFNRIPAGRDGEAVWPHMGILTTPSFLSRYPSSTSNKQRSRSFQVLDKMLGVPLMTFAEFSTASVPLTADLQVATQEYTACMVCHTAMDPIAATFASFGKNGDWDPARQVPANMPVPSFMEEEMPSALDQDGVQWLGSRLAEHPRYATGILRPLFVGLTGATIVDAPQETSAPDFDVELLAFRIQDRALTELATRFRDEMGLRIKPLVKEIVTGPLFRASRSREALDPTRAAALTRAGFGRGALITPEQMARRLESGTAVVYDTGVAFGGRDLFTSMADYRLLWGGIDFRDILVRFRSTSPLHAGIASRTGNEVACKAVPADLLRPREERRLLVGVDLDTTDESAVRGAIRRLHLQLLGEYLAEDAAEIDHTLALWRDARALGLELIASGASSAQLRTCRAGTLTTDPDYTVRAWVAVVSYLLSDSRFLFD